MCLHRILVLVVLGGAMPHLAGCGSASGSLPPQQPPKVTVAVPLAREVRDVDEYTGRTEAVQSVEVRPRVSGYLREIYFEEGGFVKQGDPLFLIDPRTYQAEFDQAQAKVKLYEAKYLYAKSVRLRSEKLVANNSVSREEYEQNVAAENEALAAMRSAEADTESARLNLEFTQINAEIAGRIDRALVTRGNLVQSGPAASVLTRIVSLDPIYVYFNPDEMAFLRYTQRRIEGDGRMEAQHVRERNIETTILLADGSLYPEKGLVDFASNAVDPSTGTIQVRAVFPNSKQALSPGLFVRLQVAAETAYPALLVPERAINTDQSDKFVYVVDAENIAQRKNVVLGTKQGRLRVIKQGLEPSDKVVISGGLLVRPGAAVQPVEGQIDEASLPVAMTQYKPAVAEPPRTPVPLPAAPVTIPAAPRPAHSAVER